MVADGWTQVTSELSFERTGPRRFLSAYRLVEDICGAVRDGTIGVPPELDAVIAKVAALHAMSTAVSVKLAEGENDGPVSTPVKILGTANEGDGAEIADQRFSSLTYSDTPGCASSNKRCALARPSSHYGWNQRSSERRDRRELCMR
jgi:hypothetical protein